MLDAGVEDPELAIQHNLLASPKLIPVNSGWIGVAVVAATQIRRVRDWRRMHLEPSTKSARHGIIERKSRIVRVVWAACLLLATLNHARILAQHGLSWDYGGVRAVSAVYWSGLTIVDPLVVVLLFIRPTIAIPVTIALITTNVAHNLAVTAMFSVEGEFLSRATSSWAIVSQIAFILLVFGTAPTAWKGRKSMAPDRSAQSN